MQEKLTYKTMEELMNAVTKFKWEELKDCRIKIKSDNRTWIIPIDCIKFEIDVIEKEVVFYGDDIS